MEKHSTGREYDSQSGHDFMIGCRTGNVIDMGVSKKKYAICQKINRTSIGIAHKCNDNAEGSSGKMESEVALRITESLYQRVGEYIFPELYLMMIPPRVLISSVLIIIRRGKFIVPSQNPLLWLIHFIVSKSCRHLFLQW